MPLLRLYVPLLAVSLPRTRSPILLVPPDCVKVPVPDKPTYSAKRPDNWLLPLRLYVPLLPGVVAEIRSL